MNNNLNNTTNSPQPTCLPLQRLCHGRQATHNSQLTTRNPQLKILFLLFLLLGSFNIYAQESKPDAPAPQTKQQKKASKKKLEQVQNAKKVEADLKERHWKNQTKATQKRMKKNRKKADRLNKHKREKTFWERVFKK